MNTRCVLSGAAQAKIIKLAPTLRVQASWRRVVLICGLLASTGVSVTAHAQSKDPDDPDDDVPAAAVRLVPRLMLSEQQFDQLVFGAVGAQQRVVVEAGQRKVVSVTSESFLKQMELLLDTEVRTVETRCQLSESQKKKLELAGRGDIARCLARISELRKKYAGQTVDQLEYEKIMMELQSLRMAPTSMQFGETSLFCKTLRKMLTNEQRQQFQAMARERSVQAVENALRTWPANVTLTGKDRRTFIDTLVDNGKFPQMNSQYFQYVVWFEIGRLEDQLRPLLDETQWQMLQQQVNNARRVEPVLRQRGVWPLPEPTDDEDPSND